MNINFFITIGHEIQFTNVDIQNFHWRYIELHTIFF